MITPRQALDRRLDDVVAGEQPAAPLLVGGCGCGRTTVLERLARLAGTSRCQLVDVERTATTPERFYRTLVATSPFLAAHDAGAPASPREAFDATLAFLASARRRDGGPAVFLLDEVLEFRTFESFPGLRTALADLCGAIADSPNTFVMTSRFAARASRLVEGRRPPFDLIAVPPLTVDEVCAAGTDAGGDGLDADTAAVVHGLGNGKLAHVLALVGAMRETSRDGATDPVGALAALLAPEGRLTAWCRYCYEFRLHRARGYGALKAILDVLSEDEPLTLTAIAQRLHRTPGSTRDYLSWLEDVDLVEVTGKRYSYADPLLRLWVRLHRRPWPPSDDDVAREVRGYALARLAAPPTPAPSAPAPPAETPAVPVRRPAARSWGIIEID